MKNKLMLQGATILGQQEMKNVKGGISAKEYCKNLRAVILNNPSLSEGAKDGANAGWIAGDCGRFYNDVVLS